MISYLKGEILKTTDQYVLVKTNDIGYLVRITTKTLSTLREHDVIELYIQTYLRDDRFEHFGFTTWDELEMFQLLTSVNGVGPKMALGVLSAHTSDSIRESVLLDKLEAFTSVSGIGKKNASRIILELKSKLGAEIDLAKLSTSDKNRELIDALRSLGYKSDEIKQMIKDVSLDLPLEHQVKQALTKNSERA